MKDSPREVRVDLMMTVLREVLPAGCSGHRRMTLSFLIAMPPGQAEPLYRALLPFP